MRPTWRYPPGTDGGGFIAAVDAMLDRRPEIAVLPLQERYVELLARKRDQISPSVRVGSPRPEVDAYLDKERMYQVARDVGVPHSPVAVKSDHASLRSSGRHCRSLISSAPRTLNERAHRRPLLRRERTSRPGALVWCDGRQRSGCGPRDLPWRQRTGRAAPESIGPRSAAVPILARGRTVVDLANIVGAEPSRHAPRVAHPRGGVPDPPEDSAKRSDRTRSGVSHHALLPYYQPMSVRDKAGRGWLDYALLLSLIAIIAIAALVVLGREISAILSMLGATMSTSVAVR